MCTPSAMNKLTLWTEHAKNLTKAERLEKLLVGTDYQIIQNNGQRIYSPRASSGIAPPPKGTEVFVGNLPPDVFEDEIIPLFSLKGAIYNVRLMMDFFGRNRGYAFVAYFRVEDAHAAVDFFNNYKMRNKTKIAVSMSVDNRRLFIGNIPRCTTLDEIKELLKKFVEGIVNVILYSEPYNERLNRGFVFVEFGSHRLAAIARRQLAPGNLVVWGQPIFVDWAEPLPVVNPEIMKQVTKLYLSNIPVSVNSDQLKSILYDLIGCTNILKIHKISDFAFIHFTQRKYAEQALRQLTGLVISDKVIGVEWARPIEYSKTHRMGKMPENYCKSVPPTMRRLVQHSINLRNKPKEKRKSSSGTIDSWRRNSE